MSVHDELLQAALRICGQRAGWRFRPIEIVQALPHLNPATVRTHIVSRCCVNAPKNHPHKWDYFVRISRGVYEIRSAYRTRRRAAPSRRPSTRSGRAAGKGPVASEPRASYTSAQQPLRDTVHAIVSRGGGWYTAECLEVGVVTQGRTLDELVENLRQAVELHIEGEDAASLGLTGSPRLAVTYEFRPHDR